MEAKELLAAAKTILVIDWPLAEVPETLALAGFDVVVKGGPGPADFSVYELTGAGTTTRKLRPPEHADLVYAYRPLSELAEIVETARSLHARTVWTQSGYSAAGVKDPRGCWLSSAELQRAKSLVQKGGLNYVSEPYIADAAREIRSSR